MSTYAADLQAIRAAHARICEHVHRTPVLTCRAVDRLAGRRVYFKCENFQKVGAFKFRGACHAVTRLTDEQARHGVVTHSSGNHAQALALAAALRGIDAHVVMPSNAPAVKRAAVEEYGARIHTCEPTLAARESLADRVMQETGAAFIPPYNHPDVIAGQGTCALEFLEEVPQLEAVVAPIGGGGLLSGIAIAVRGMAEGVKVFGAEPLGADDAARSKAAGRLIPQTSPNTVADGLLTSMGDLTWPVVRDLVSEIVTVDDAALIEAMRFVWERMKIVIEPSSATALAAVLSDHAGLAVAGHVGVVLTGGNVDLGNLPW